MKFYDDLKWRDLIKDVTNNDLAVKKLNSHCVVYSGFDPTADSLHIGHMQQLILLRRFQNYGHKVIVLCGGATGMIGDPRPSSERKLLSEEEINHNVKALKSQFGQIVDLSDPDKGILVNNYDWISKISLIEYLRDFAKLFNVSYIINKETIASRLASGISVTEFSYTTLQAIDFLHLYRKYNCDMQIGGSEQWGNIVSGYDLIHKLEGEQVELVGMTNPLITNSDGKKFGKSEGENIWLDANKTSDYRFYQYWINVSDDMIENLYKRLSLKPKEEIEKIINDSNKEPHLRIAQKELAKELTILVRGEKAFEKALRLSEALFSNKIMELGISEIKEVLSKSESIILNEDTNILDVLIGLKISNSKSEARKLVLANSISINDNKINDINYMLSKKDALEEKIMILKKGKKYYYIVEFK